MESRLIPINAVIGPAAPDGVNPAVLTDHGYRVAGLEVPVRTPLGSVVIDMAVANGDTGHIVVVESKCGGNVEKPQCLRYAALDAAAVVRNAYIDLRRRVIPTVDVVYACLGAYVDRVRLGLNAAGVTFPVLAVRDHKITVEGSAFGGPLRKTFGLPITLEGPPSRLIPFDADSNVEIIEPYVQTALVAALSHNLSDISPAALTEWSIRHFPLLGEPWRNKAEKHAPALS